MRLAAGAHTQTARFAIRRDPRASATDEDLRKQFTLLIEIRDAMTSAHQAVNDVIRARSELEAAVSRARGTEGERQIGERAAAIQAALERIQSELIQMNIRTGNDVLSYPIKLNARIASVGAVVAAAEARPTDQAVAAFTELKAELDSRLAVLHEVFEKDVAAFNTLADRYRVPHVGGRTKPTDRF